MKLGAENRKKTLAAVALFVIALFMVSRTFFRGGSAQSPVARAFSVPQAAVPALPANNPRLRPAAVRRNRRSASQQQTPEPALSATLDPRLRLDLLAAAEQTEYTGQGRNIFRPEADPVIPKPVAPAMRPPEQQAKLPPPGPPPPPPPPPIKLKFFGFATSPGAPKKVFLSEGDDVFVAGEGEIVDRRYKIIHIGDQSVTVEDLLNNHQQTLPLAS